jgi:S-disulfanyl-L-cysteine oxidoreductase SoxD
MRGLLWTMLAGAMIGGATVLVSFPIAAQDDQIQRGHTVFVERCAKCHGEQGEGKLGRALISPTANLGGYGTARGLFDYTRKIMPIDAPGKLLESEYWAVLAYILKENKLLPDGTTLGRQNAGGVRLGQQQ